MTRSEALDCIRALPGIHCVTLTDKSEILTRDKGDFLRFYRPTISKRRSGFAMLGVIGIMSLGFEDAWAGSVKIEDRDWFAPMAGTMIENVVGSRRMSLPLASSLEEIAIWTNTIMDIVEEFPRSSSELISAIDSGSTIAGLRPQVVLNYPEKLASFRFWSRNLH